MRYINQSLAYQPMGGYQNRTEHLRQTRCHDMYHRDCNKSYTTGVSSGTGTGAPILSWVRVTKS